MQSLKFVINHHYYIYIIYKPPNFQSGQAFALFGGGKTDRADIDGSVTDNEAAIKKEKKKKKRNTAPKIGKKEKKKKKSSSIIGIYG